MSGLGLGISIYFNAIQTLRDIMYGSDFWTQELAIHDRVGPGSGTGSGPCTRFL